jgi:hypothetical protein
MSDVFQNIDPPPPHRPAGEDTLAGWRGGWGFNILEDARHCSVLYIRKYFVGPINIQSGRYYSRPFLLFTLAKHFTSSKIVPYKLKGMLPFIDSYYIPKSHPRSPFYLNLPLKWGGCAEGI